MRVQPHGTVATAATLAPAGPSSIPNLRSEFAMSPSLSDLDPLEIKMELVRSPDDPKRNDPLYVSEVMATAQRLMNSGIRFSQRGMAFDAVAGGGFPLADFTLQVIQATAPALAAVLTAWIARKPGRKVKMKVGSIELEANSAEEIKNLIKSAMELKGKPKKDGG